MMKKAKGANWKKRVLSAALAIGMVITMISAADWANIANAAASNGRSESLLFQDQGKALRTRAVLDELPIPADKRSGAEYDAWIANWQSGEKGTYNRPFMILELVPYYEQGNFGWLIDGCEPIDIDRLRGNSNLMSGIEYLEAKNFYTINQITETTHFFPDETEGRREFYTANGTYKFDTTTWEGMKKTDSKQVKGYWEVVENKTGTHRIATDPENGGKHIVAANNMVSGEEGNLIWHTTDNKFTMDHMKAIGFDLEDPDSVRWYMTLEQIRMGGGNVDDFIAYLKLDTIGSRYYTTRVAGTHDPYLEIPGYSMYDFQSKDVFVCDTIGKSLNYDKSKPGTSAQEYSVWIKTITPEELNNNPQWVDLADLVFVQRFNHTTAMTDLYKAKDAGGQYYNRFMKMPVNNAFQQDKSTFGGTYDANDYPGYNGKRKDITWSVAAKLLKRVSASRNFIGIVFDKTVRDTNAADTKYIEYYRYDLDDVKVSESDKFGQQGYKDNIFKLWMICTSTKPNLTQRFYMNSGKIVEDANGYGVFAAETNRTTDESMYWSPISFFCAESMYPDVNLNQIDAGTTYWQDYTGYFNNTAYVSYVQGHTYTYSGDQSLYQCYEVDGKVGADKNHFDDFNHYITTNDATKKIWGDTYSGSYSSINSETAPPWIAIRYILELDVDNYSMIDEITVLDIEPSVPLGAGSKPVWKLTENDVALMVPSLSADAKIIIEHNIMNSFVGRNEDLNGKYDMIYLGDDGGGLWNGIETMDSDFLGHKDRRYVNDPATAGETRTNFLDNSMDGLVYFHIGDYFRINANDRKSKHAKFIYDVTGGGYNYDADNAHKVDTANLTRQPGIDLTNVKKKDLLDYLKAEYPIVAAPNLYDNSEHPYVDKSSDSIIWDFLSKNRAAKDSSGNYSNGVLLQNEVSEIDKKVYNRRASEIKILSTPVLYNDSDKANTYLPKEGSYAKLNFKVQVPNTSDYSYRILVDQDRNGKLVHSLDVSKDEVIQSGRVDSLEKSITAYVTDGWIGFIQWKIEVYKTTNESVRLTKEGCSAIRANAGVEKNKIIALQIAPNNTGQGWIDISSHNGNGTPKTNNRNWTNLYDQADDFEIEVYRISYAEFERLFRANSNPSDKGTNREGQGASYNFHYNMGEPINISESSATTNPNIDILSKIQTQEDHPWMVDNWLGGHPLAEFNMMILGFGDMYRNTDMSNEYGCAEYLFYFAEAGHSILFTHDLTIFFNDPECGETTDNWTNNHYGYTANTMMRSLMGQNRYGVVSANIVNDRTTRSNFNIDGNGTLAKALAAYDARKGISFDKTSSIYRQGYTYWDLVCKIGANGMTNNWDRNQRAQYKYMMKDPENSNTYYVWEGGSVSRNAETDTAVKLNDGQITSYPFHIDEVLKIARTHSQYYALNMEDPELTVWYTLEDGKVYNGTQLESGATFTSDTTARNSGDILGLIYGVTPQNPSDNYYIYSKGNIFYSGVGHREVNGDPERKLFVNTLIAAYRPSFEKPEIVITNTEAAKTARRQYQISVDQEFDYNEAGDLTTGSSMGGDSIAVTFIPRDYSGSPTVRCAIYYEDGIKYFGTNSSGDPATTQIYEVINSGGVKTQGPEVTTHPSGSGLENYYVLQTEHEYMIYYPKKNLRSGNSKWNHIQFDVQNDKVLGETAITDLYVKPRPLFILD